jgi:endonuclease/exonuclease/phosphatase family metal-dependent hydrolase
MKLNMIAIVFLVSSILFSRNLAAQSSAMIDASAALLAAGYQTSSAEISAAATSPAAKTLSILSWNIYMLPPAILKTGKIQRAKAIAEELLHTHYDIIVFQEAFHPRARHILQSKLSQLMPYTYGPANAGGLKVNSGVWILSHLQMNPIKEIKYKDCTGVDCYSKKGAVLLEGKKDDVIFQIIGTHLQSEGPQAIRQHQYEEIYNELAIPFQEPNIPQIICGDFNTSSLDQCSYNDMVCTLDCENGVIDGCITNTFRDGNDQIDYILIRKNGCKIEQQHREIKEFFHNWISRKNKFIQSPALSDHNAMEIQIKF